MKKIVNIERSIIPACDVVDLKKLREIVKSTYEVDKVSAYKVGFEIGLSVGLKNAVKEIRKFTDKPIIYDHQKGGTDIPEKGEKFASVCADAGIDAIIIFPFTGPKSEDAWIDSINKHGLGLIVGAEMTHANFLASAGGYISDDAPKKIFSLAAKKGVTNFVVPSNKLDHTAEYKKFIESCGVKPVFYLPGINTQGGEIEAVKKLLKTNFHAIVGRSLYESKDMKKTAIELAGLL